MRQSSSHGHKVVGVSESPTSMQINAICFRGRFACGRSWDAGGSDAFEIPRQRRSSRGGRPEVGSEVQGRPGKSREARRP